MKNFIALVIVVALLTSVGCGKQGQELQMELTPVKTQAHLSVGFVTDDETQECVPGVVVLRYGMREVLVEVDETEGWSRQFYCGLRSALEKADSEYSISVIVMDRSPSPGRRAELEIRNMLQDVFGLDFFRKARSHENWPTKKSEL